MKRRGDPERNIVKAEGGRRRRLIGGKIGGKEGGNKEFG